MTARIARPEILVTGGSGFIGSHALVSLIQAGYKVVVLDDLSNSDVRALERVGLITGRFPIFVEGDVRDRGLLRTIFSKHAITAVMHFAGLKAVGESAAEPTRYYDVNLAGTVALVGAMAEAKVHVLVFSSSATVYGTPECSPVSEASPYAPLSPYGRTKVMAETLLNDLARSDDRWRIACLRYFNPIGAHESGLLGELPLGAPNNLLPLVAQVASGQRHCVVVHGHDYETTDGTGVRDYVHVMDIAEGHVAALDYALKHPGMLVANLGTGQGASVLELIGAFETASGRRIACEFGPRRLGDVPACWADVSHAGRTMGWRASRTLSQMCADSWRWQLTNPTGYGTRPSTNHSSALPSALERSF